MSLNRSQAAFEKDLNFGQIREEFVIYKFWKYTKNIKRFNTHECDFVFEHKKKLYSVEVKHCDIVNVTGNFSVEVESNGKPSGIDRFKGDYWVFIDRNDEIYITKTKDLYNACKGRPKLDAKFCDGFTKYVVFPKSEFEKIRIPLEDLFK
jgi:hypothetical protein